MSETTTEDRDDSLDHLPQEARTSIQSTVIEVAEQYADSIKRSRTENKKRAKGRAKIDELGVRTDAFQHGLRLVKDLTISEQKQYLRDLKMVISVVGQRQMELFPEDALRNKKREEDRMAKEAEARTKAGVDSDTNPRSDPKRGGAGKGKSQASKAAPKGPAATKAAALVKAAASKTATGPGSEPGKMMSQVEQDEQAEGAAILEGAKPKSQSAIAAEARAAIGEA